MFLFLLGEQINKNLNITGLGVEGRGGTRTVQRFVALPHSEVCLEMTTRGPSLVTRFKATVTSLTHWLNNPTPALGREKLSYVIRMRSSEFYDIWKMLWSLLKDGDSARRRLRRNSFTVILRGASCSIHSELPPLPTKRHVNACRKYICFISCITQYLFCNVQQSYL